MAEYGLPTNVEKSICYGKIGLLTEAQKKKLLHSDHFNYDLRDDYRGEVKLMQERRENLNHYLEDNSFDMRSLGYIFGNHTLQEAKDWCFQEYRKQIISSEIGRGSNFRRFYDYLFRNEWYLNIVIYENLFDLIPTSSVNFSNFIDSLYLAVQNKEISSRCFERIKREYLTKVEKDDLADNDVAVLEALLMIQMEEKDDEP